MIRQTKMNARTPSWLLKMLLVLGCCSCSFLSHQPHICNCCAATYTNINSAQNCLLATVPTHSSADNRLLLIAFFDKDIKANQELGWHILHDQEIIKAAKRNYLLVTLDVNDFKGSPELLAIIRKHKKRPFFVIVNQALYPFADWAVDEDKDYIISRLSNGNGP